MEIRNFPGCCTMKVAVGLGDTRTAEYNAYGSTDADDVEEELLELVEGYKEAGMAVLTVTTNNQQKVANKVLKRMGFSHSKWCSKTQHPETRVRLWWLPLEGV